MDAGLDSVLMTLTSHFDARKLDICGAMHVYFEWEVT